MSIINSYNDLIPQIRDVPILETRQTTVVKDTAKSAENAGRILVADDDEQVRRLFSKELTRAGYSVTEAHGGRDALSLLRRMHFQLLVLDLDMPGVDGFEVLKTVRSEFPDLTVPVISGYLEGALLKAAECFGAQMALDKTVAPKLLVETTRKLLRHRSK